MMKDWMVDINIGRIGLLFVFFAIILMGNTTTAVAEQNQSVDNQSAIMNVTKLPGAQAEKNALMSALKNRKTTRGFDSKELSKQTLSDLLWAAFGVNRPKEMKRTAPSAHNWQQIDIYITDANGLYLYNARNNTIAKILSEDIRALTGMQRYPKSAPVSLVYVMDQSKIHGEQPEDLKVLFSWATAGAIAQNVYLFCASEGLNAALRADIDRELLHEKMKLRKDQKILLAQSVGYPEHGIKQWLKKILNK